MLKKKNVLILFLIQGTTVPPLQILALLKKKTWLPVNQIPVHNLPKVTN